MINPSNLINAKIPSIAAVNQLHASSPFLVKKKKELSPLRLSLYAHIRKLKRQNKQRRRRRRILNYYCTKFSKKIKMQFSKLDDSPMFRQQVSLFFLFRRRYSEPKLPVSDPINLHEFHIALIAF